MSEVTPNRPHEESTSDVADILSQLEHRHIRACARLSENPDSRALKDWLKPTAQEPELPSSFKLGKEDGVEVKDFVRAMTEISPLFNEDIIEEFGIFSPNNLRSVCKVLEDRGVFVINSLAIEQASRPSGNTRVYDADAYKEKKASLEKSANIVSQVARAVLESKPFLK